MKPKDLKPCYARTKQIDEKNGIIPFVLTKFRVDRDGDVIIPQGALLEDYRKNPLILYMHDMTIVPPAKLLTESILITETEVTADVKFDIENDPFGAFLFQKYLNGYLSAGSIRFMPTEFDAEPILPDQSGFTVREWKLLEYSLVTIPSNPDALRKDYETFSEGKFKDFEAPYYRQLCKFYESQNPAGIDSPNNITCVDSAICKYFAGEDFQIPADIETVSEELPAMAKSEEENLMSSNRDFTSITAAIAQLSEGGAKSITITGEEGNLTITAGSDTPVPYPPEPTDTPILRGSPIYKKNGGLILFDEEAVEYPAEPEPYDVKPIKMIPDDKISKEAAKRKFLLQGVAAKKFRIEDQEMEPHHIAHSYAAKFCGIDIKELFVLSVPLDSLWKGTFVDTFKMMTSNWHLHDVRNITSSNKEAPPRYEHIQLNSTESIITLAQGKEFKTTDTGYNVMIDYSLGGWYEEITFYCGVKNAEHLMFLLNCVWEDARENHKLKNEAFTLSGKFLNRGEMTWDKIFLPERNKAPLKKAVKTINNLGANSPNRGYILMGPPGTGKTLSGKAILAECKSTFIWVSAKDFWNYGGMYGMSKVFEMAKLLAPAIIFLEDVDNYITPKVVDLLKTEMDGLEISKGVTTMLTTNFPDQIPDALIDRPGRFHEILEIDFPEVEQRKEMLNAWYPSLNADFVIEFVKLLDGYSGAHIFELVQYAKSLVEEDTELLAEEAVTKAFVKVKEQRELISESQLAGSTYRPDRKSLSTETLEVLAVKYPEAVEGLLEAPNGMKAVEEEGSIADFETVAKQMINLLSSPEGTVEEKLKEYQRLAAIYKYYDKEPPVIDHWLNIEATDINPIPDGKKAELSGYTEAELKLYEAFRKELQTN